MLLLTEQDCQKISRIKINSRVLELIYGRYVCKKILSMYTKIELSKLDFKYGIRGKPFIESNPVLFNLSHSGDFLALCIADSEVGIDIEIPDKNLSTDINYIANAHFTPAEAETIISASNAEASIATFYRLWTCKEAALKVIGLGLHHPMNEIDCLKLLDIKGITICVQGTKYTIKGEHHLIEQGACHLAIAKCGDFGARQIYVENYDFFGSNVHR
jgi:4'-phosphopantetheinyl transferase